MTRQEPTHILALLTDIISTHVERISRPKQVACVIELVRGVTLLSMDDGSMLVVHRAVRALRRLVAEMMHKSTGAAEDREVVATEAGRLCSFLQAKTSERLISSSCHSRMLSCSRASTSAQPGLAWLAMYQPF
jgi:hypothetical protein